VRVRFVRRCGKIYAVIDTRPSKRIRRAQKRLERRMREIHEHFKNRKNKERDEA